MRVVVLVVLAAAVSASAQPAKQLELKDAIKLALTHNERSRIADLDVESAAAAVDKARVAFLPVLNAKGANAYQPRDKPTDKTTGSLEFDLPLFAPSAFPLYSQAKHELDAQKAQSTDDLRTLEFDTAKAFFNVLLAVEVVAAAQKKLDTAKADLADTDAQVKAQLVSSNDVTRAQIGLGGSVRELVADQGTLQTAYVNLSFLLKTPVTGGLAPPTDVITTSAKPTPPVDTLVAHGIAKRPDLVARKQAALAAHDFAREPRMRYLPTLGAAGVITGTSDAGMSGHNFDGSVSVTAGWTIFDGGARSADSRSRDAQAEIDDLEAAMLERQVDAQIRAAAIALAAAQQAAVAAQQAMDAARKSADETAILYKQGLAKAIELIDANDERFTQEVSFAEAQFDVATSYLALRQAMGLDPTGGDL